jgi:hypothetical protein
MEPDHEHSCNPFSDNTCDQCLEDLIDWQREVWAKQMASIMGALEELEERTDGMYDEVAELLRNAAEEADEPEPPDPDPELPEVPLRKPKKRSRQSKKGDQFTSKRTTIVAPSQTPASTSPDQEENARFILLNHPEDLPGVESPKDLPEAKAPFEFRDEDFPPLQ